MKHLLQDLLAYTALMILKYQREQLRDVFPSASLLQVLQDLKETANSRNLNLPFSLTEDTLTAFYDYVNIQSTVVNEHIFFVYSVPLVQATEFESYKILPRPLTVNGSIFQLILPDIQRIAIDKERRKYFNMDNIDLDNCFRKGLDLLVCGINQPIISTEDSGSCSVELLTELQLTRCDFRIANIEHEMWIEIQPNNWMCVLPEPEDVWVKCKGIVYRQFFAGSASFLFQSDCTVTTKYVEIIGSRNDLAIGEHVQVQAQKSIDWKEVTRAVAPYMTRKNEPFPRFVHNKDIRVLFERNSISINDVIIHPKINETITYSSTSSKIEQDGEAIKLNSTFSEYASDLRPYVIYAIISLFMCILAFVLNKTFIKVCKLIKQKKKSRNECYDGDDDIEL